MASIATKNKKQGQKQEWAVSFPTAKNERQKHNFLPSHEENQDIKDKY